MPAPNQVSASNVNTELGVGSIVKDSGGTLITRPIEFSSFAEIY